jgi:cyclopropane fatty-acyl-phospholipid synthase-like methyltransferase
MSIANIVSRPESTAGPAAGNAMYKLFLDESMTYSSGVHHPGHSLHQAQLNKLDAIIARAEIGPNDHVLEIGCGWGSFAIRAASKTGCRWAHAPHRAAAALSAAARRNVKRGGRLRLLQRCA